MRAPTEAPERRAAYNHVRRATSAAWSSTGEPDQTAGRQVTPCRATATDLAGDEVIASVRGRVLPPRTSSWVDGVQCRAGCTDAAISPTTQGDCTLPDCVRICRDEVRHEVARVE
jgi:hypothetical protein